jgi:hypothetical protein
MLEEEDIVQLESDPTKIGVVSRTHTSSDSDSDTDSWIDDDSDRNVRGDFQNFLRRNSINNRVPMGVADLSRSGQSIVGSKSTRTTGITFH